jgi:hypothetical protein
MFQFSAQAASSWKEMIESHINEGDTFEIEKRMVVDCLLDSLKQRLLCAGYTESNRQFPGWHA